MNKTKTKTTKKNLATLRTIHTIETLDHKRTLTVAELQSAVGGMMPSDPMEREADSVADRVMH